MAGIDVTITQRVHDLFRARGLRLAVAESCTGGRIADMLSSLPGASGFFEASVVCYSREAKERLLGLNASVLDAYGTVSTQTAAAMAEAVIKRTGADVSLAVTGNLGPAPIENKKVGGIHMAVSVGATVQTRDRVFSGDRGQIKQAAAEAALEFLCEALTA